MVTNSSTSREFDIQRGVRQGCMLSSTSFGFVLEWRMAESIFWSLCIRAILLHQQHQQRGSIPAWWSCKTVVSSWCDTFNANNMQILTTHVQPPKAITTGNGSGVEFIDRKGFHKYPEYSCLSGSKHESHKLDLRYCLSKVLKSIVCKKKCNNTTTVRDNSNCWNNVAIPHCSHAV